MSCVYNTHLESKRVQYYTMAIFGLLHTGFTIMLVIRFNDWNDDLPGRCYITSKAVSAHPVHPSHDKVYVGITSYYVYISIITVTISCRMPTMRLLYQKFMFPMGTLLSLLNMYTLLTLRISNEPLLDNTALENEWGFGQVVAMLMLAATLLECARSFEGKRTFAEA